jgi:hypothetical protein
LPISIAATRTSLAASYATLLPYGALFTSTGPGTTGAATNEVTGGSPAYNRKANNWGTAAASVVTTTSAPSFDVPAATTPTYYGACSSVTPGAATVGDATTVTNQTFASQGTYVITPTYSQS